jgi:hypothetical protein
MADLRLSPNFGTCKLTLSGSTGARRLFRTAIVVSSVDLQNAALLQTESGSRSPNSHRRMLADWLVGLWGADKQRGLHSAAKRLSRGA